MSAENAGKLLVSMGKKKFEEGMSRKESYPFMSSNEENAFLNDLVNYPHAFFLACLMDKQVKAEKAWHIPWQIKEILGAFDIGTLTEVSVDEYKRIFNEYRMHRFNEIQAELFWLAVNRIKDVYDGDVSRIWKGKPSSAKVVYDFLQFKGAGVKIATMATNILARDLHVEFSDYYSIDISPDVHIMKIMQRTGLVEKKADRDGVIYKAREVNPEFPGIIDYACWEIGVNWCKPTSPDCEHCPLGSECEKRLY